MTSRRALRRADVEAALDVYDALTEQGTAAASLMVGPGEITVLAADNVTPPQGVRVLRRIEDMPAPGRPPLTIDRHPGWVGLASRFSGRRLRLRVRRGGP